ncbi:MAG: diaminopimelate decarboxylase [Oscillospiraceae bacterium]|nr:diaminopimelate decarboxylase [Oscillospiraceae bacterium]
MLYDNLSVSENGHLCFAGYDTAELAARYGTPLMVLDEDRIRSRCRVYKHAMKEHFPAGSMPLFASKALSFKGIYAIMAQEGIGIDVVSSGELYTALEAGFPPGRMYFHGNNKTDFDIRFAIQSHIGYFVCDNIPELEAIEQEAAQQDVTQKILLRLAPGIDAHTHEKINTGRIDSKFGVAIETGQAEELVALALQKPHIALCGYHCHIGSQIFEHTPFCDAAVMMLDFMAQMQRKYGYQAKILNLGGGMAVPYTEKDPTVDYSENIRKISALIQKVCREKSLDVPVVLMEPGRSIVADSGITLYTVGGAKVIPDLKNYLMVDGGMTDNPRYTLYQSEYTVCAPEYMHDTPDMHYSIAGRCCESGDLIQENVPLPKLNRGDLLAVLTTGAYNYSMASNYNRLTRPAVILIGDEGPRVAVRRESLSDLIRNDV